MNGSLGNPPWCVQCRGNQKPGEGHCPRCKAAWKVPIPEATSMKFFQDYFSAGTFRGEADTEWCPCICIKFVGTELSAEQYEEVRRYEAAGYIMIEFPDFPVCGVYVVSPIFHGDLCEIVRRMHADTGLMRSLPRVESTRT